MLKKAWYDKIILGWVIFVLIPLVALEVFYATKMTGSMEKSAVEQATYITKGLTDMMQAVLTEEMKILSLMAADDNMVERSTSRHRRETLTSTLNQWKAKLGNGYESLFLTDAGGTVIAETAGGAYGGANLGSTDFFQTARGGKAAIGAPFKSKKTGGLVSIICAPVYERQGKFAGAIGAGLKLDGLFAKMASVKIGGTGYSLMVDKTGLVLVHSDKRKVLNLNIRTIPGMDGIAAMMLGQQSGAETFLSEGIKKIAVFAPVELTGWSVCVIQDAEDVIVLPRSTRNNIFITAGILLVIAILGALYLPRRIAKAVGNEDQDGTDAAAPAEPYAAGTKTSLAGEESAAPVLPGRAPSPEEESSSAGRIIPPPGSIAERAYVGHVSARAGRDYDRLSSFIKRPFEKQNYYEILELSPNVTPFEIRQAYKTALQIYQAGSLVSYSFFSEEERSRILGRLEEAYLTLISEDARTQYDRMLVERGELEENQTYRKTHKKSTPIFDMKEYKSSSSVMSDMSERVRARVAETPAIDTVMAQDVLTGADLKRIRTDLGVSLREISELTRIRIGLLHAIEEDHIDQISSRFHLESFLKSYANCLQLDADTVVNRYMKRYQAMS